MKITLFLFLALLLKSDLPTTTLSKNDMTVSWNYKQNRIFIEMSAPTDGWVAIGFNNTSAIKGNYLLMGRVVSQKPELVEFYTISAGNYQPITTLGAEVKVEDVKGGEQNGHSLISFSLPIKSHSKYQKPLNEGLKYTLLMAYSRSDDFKHHSMMRTSLQIKL